MISLCPCNNNITFIYQLSYIHKCQFCNNYTVIFMMSCKHMCCKLCLKNSNVIKYSPSVKIPILQRYTIINNINDANYIIKLSSSAIKNLFKKLYYMIQLYSKTVNANLLTPILDAEIAYANTNYLYNLAIISKQKLNF